MSDSRLPENVDLRWVGTRLMTMTAEIRDVQNRMSVLERRFTVLENRFTALETRIGAMESRLSGIEDRLDGVEQRLTALLAVLVRVAERIDGGTPPANPLTK